LAARSGRLQSTITTPPPRVAAAAAAAPAPVQAPPVAAGAPAATVTLPDFTRIASQHGKAVVNIRVVGSTKTSMRGGPQIDPNDPFYEFFRRSRARNLRAAVATYPFSAPDRASS
jgi:serine protease Do